MVYHLQHHRILHYFQKSLHVIREIGIKVNGWDINQLVAALRERRINSTAQIRIYALLDFDDKGVKTSLRLSPHYYNTEAEVEQVATTINELVLTRV